MDKNIFWLTSFCLVSYLPIVKAHDTSDSLDSMQYATIYICRPYSLFGAGVGFGIRKGEVKLFKLQNNSIRKLKIYQPGPVVLSAKCVDRVSKITINIELGKLYFIQCTPHISYLFANPKLQLVDNEKGKQAYEAIIDEK